MLPSFNNVPDPFSDLARKPEESLIPDPGQGITKQLLSSENITKEADTDQQQLMDNTSTKPAESLLLPQTDNVASPTNALSLKRAPLQTPVSDVKNKTKAANLLLSLSLQGTLVKHESDAQQMTASKKVDPSQAAEGGEKPGTCTPQLQIKGSNDHVS